VSWFLYKHDRRTLNPQKHTVSVSVEAVKDPRKRIPALRWNVPLPLPNLWIGNSGRCLLQR